MSTDSGIDDSVELHLIDTRQLIEEDKKLQAARKIRKQADTEKKKLTQSIGPLSNLVKEASDKNILGVPIGTRGPKGFFGGGNQTFKSAVGGARTQNAFTDAQKKQADLENQVKELQKKQEETEKKQEDLAKDLQKKQEAADKKQLELNEELVGGAQDAISAAVNPTVIPLLALSALKRFGIVGTIVGSALSFIIGPLVQDIQKQFDRGGALDTKLKVPRQALTVNNIDDSNSWNDGTKYITSDLRIVQKAPQSSNTLKISHEAVRYVLDDLGKFS